MSISQATIFTFYYQPYFRAKDLSLTGFEALVRIVDKDGKVYTPGAFIDYLENSEYLLDFEQWVLNKVKEVAERWKIRIVFNLSAKTLSDLELIESISLPSNVVLEITERLFASVREKDLNHLRRLKNLYRFMVAIDDFGTGYSSLSYLANLPIDVVKIDMSFVKLIVNDYKVRAIVETVISMCKKLGLETIGEGVEREEELKLLQEMGCTYVQGYLLGKPMPEEEAYKLLIQK